MNKRFKRLIALGALSITLIGNQFIVYAEDIPKPQKPIIEGELTNEKITEYNKQVTEYNKQVDEYNKKIDNKYAADVAAVALQNSQIEAHNQQEQANLELA